MTIDEEVKLLKRVAKILYEESYPHFNCNPRIMELGKIIDAFDRDEREAKGIADD